MQTSMLEIANIIGIMGVILVLVAYYFLQTHQLEVTSKIYSVLNLVGSCLILYSLFFHWNTPAVLMEAIWVTISFWGTVKSFYRSFHLPSSAGAGEIELANKEA